MSDITNKRIEIIPADKVYRINIKECDIKFAQKEMEIISNLVMNNTRIIMWTRNFLIVALTALIGYTIKEVLLNDKLCKQQKIEVFIPFIFIMITLTTMIFLIELIVTTWQNAHINRLWQLDIAINKKIIQEEEKNSSMYSLGKILIHKAQKVQLFMQFYHPHFSYSILHCFLFFLCSIGYLIT